MTRAPTTRPTSERASASPRPARQASQVTVDPIRVLRQNIWLIVVTIAVGSGLGLGAHYFFEWAYPLYEGEVRFVLKPPLAGGMDVIAQELVNEETVVRLAQTEAARITSRDTLLPAVVLPDVKVTNWAEGFRDLSGVFVPDAAVDELIDDLRAGHRRGQQIFYLAWRTHKPEDVPVVLNSIADTYMTLRRRDDDRRFNQTTDVFRQQLQALDSQILDIKTQINKFIAEKGITKTEGGGGSRQDEVKKLGEQIVEAQKDADMLKARKVHIERRLDGTLEPSAEDIRAAEGDQVLMNAMRDLHELKTQYAAVQSNFGKDHPTVRRVQSQLESAEQNLNARRAEIVTRNLRADYKDVSDRVDAIQQTLARQQEDYIKRSKDLESLAADMTELENMRDRLKQYEDDRKAINSSLSEIATVRARDDAARIEIVQRATIPREMNFPKMKVMIPVTALLCLAVVLAIVFSREFMDQRVRYTSDLSGLPGGRILGVIPDAADDPSGVKEAGRAVRERPNSVVTEAYRQTAVQIGKGLEAGHKIIEVLTPMPGGGTTSAVANLASVAKGMVRKVLVIDANFRRPTLGAVMGVNDEAKGLGDLLSTGGTMVGVTQPSDGIDVLTSGTPSSRIPEQLNSARLEEVLAEARTLYDIVIVDAPPAVIAGEGMNIANRVDATILVVHAWNDQRGLVARLAHQLLDVRSVFLGVVLNRPRSTAGGYFRKNAAAIAAYSKSSR